MITHDELIKFGFKLNFPNHSQAFYSFEIDDKTQLYYSAKDNKVSLFKNFVGNVHQFQNITTVGDIQYILNAFLMYK